MKKLFKRLFKTALFRYIIIWLAAAFIRLVYYTSRRQIDIHEAARPYASGEKPCMIAFWHGRLMMMPMVRPRGRKMHVMISSHRDGEMIARTMHRFGFGTIRGSTSRGGIMAGKGAIKALRHGDNVSITPDGPRGPVLKIQPGVTILATMAKVPVVPMTFSASRHKRARSWDRFMIALPFSTLYYKIGAPLWDVTPEALEAAMVTQMQEADAHVRILS